MGMRLYHVGMNVIAQHGMKVTHRGEAPPMQWSVQSCGDAAGGISTKNAAEIYFHVK